MYKIRLDVAGLAFLLVAGVFFAFGLHVGFVSKPKAGLTQKTLDHLTTAMRGESFAYTKYLLYSQHARENGNAELGDLFEQTAKTERFQHFSEEAKLAALIGSDADNLKDAISGEASEINTMYFRFAEDADSVGDFTASKLFREIRQDEMVHHDAFQEALTKLVSPVGGN
jgi:rubrerythrin